MPARLLVTGSSGFVGRAVANRAAADGWQVRASTRQADVSLPAGVQPATGLDLTAGTDWRAALDGVAAVVHCAARVHVMRDNASDPLSEFRRVNVAGTLSLACQAADAGVRRFVFISSIGVNGAATTDLPFQADDRPAPHSPYAQSKYEAELGLHQIARASGLELVVIRPPLVYGPGAPGNFAKLMRALYGGLPLPLGAVHNRRSFVGLDNLMDLIMVCLVNVAASNQTFLVSDDDDMSTTAMLRRTANALGCPARLLPIPAPLLGAVARALGKADLAQRLFGSLQVDIGKTCSLLGWAPVRTVEDGLQRTAAHFLAERQIAQSAALRRS